ncbi:MAG: benzoate-CoA ligase family protein [Deltaproteobacteria bacterium]|nr:MAG: benzoate-CoA ligase family protein [Deltaproteobacteria bacterium]
MLSLNLPRRFNAAEYFVDRNVEKGRGDDPAILFENRTYTYRQVQENVNRAAHMLSNLGLEMENRVIILLRDSPAVIFSFFGAIKLGAVPVPTNILMKAPDFLHVLNDSRAKVLIVDALLLPEVEKILDQTEFLKKIVVVGDVPDHRHLDYNDLMAQAAVFFPAARTTPDDVAFWLYSGRNPETLMAAVHHHSHMVYCAEGYGKQVLGMTAKDRVMGVFLFFAYGLGNSVYLPFSVGASTVLSRKRPLPELIYQDLVDYRPTLFFSVPTLLEALSDYKQKSRAEGKELPPADSLRATISSAELLSSDVYHRFKSEFGVDILDGTGSTEICHIFLSNRMGDVKPGSTGKPVPGFDMKLLDDDGQPVGPGEIGNLRVRGGSIASAYWNRRRATKENMRGDWFVTGDRYMMDTDGYYYFKGRSDDMLRVGGKWLSPVEVETALNAHPTVAESAVVGYRDEKGLQTPYAFIVLLPGNTPSEPLGDDIKAFVKDRIAPYKYPRRIAFVTSLPKTTGGRIKRFELKPKVSH